MPNRHFFRSRSFFLFYLFLELFPYKDVTGLSRQVPIEAGELFARRPKKKIPSGHPREFFNNNWNWKGETNQVTWVQHLLKRFPLWGVVF